MKSRKNIKRISHHLLLGRRGVSVIIAVILLKNVFSLFRKDE